MTHVYWIRCGESQADSSSIFSCRKIDPSLTGNGILQSRKVASYLQGKRPNALYSSPLKRALETADFISKKTDLPIIPIESFRDINVGDLERQTLSDQDRSLFDQVIRSWILDDRACRFPGGEDLYTLIGRVGDGFSHVAGRHPEGKVVVVGHALLLTVVLKSICPEFDPVEAIDTTVGFCSITELKLVKYSGKVSGELLSWASDVHL